MISKSLLLISGRTSRQGSGISEGKFRSAYQAETSTLLISPEDMQLLGLADGDRVRVSAVEHGVVESLSKVALEERDNSHGNRFVVLTVETAKGGELPPGLVFVAYGDASCRLMASDTHGSGMPTSKGIDVLLEKLPPRYDDRT